MRRFLLLLFFAAALLSRAGAQSSDTIGFKGFRAHKMPRYVNIVKASPVSYLWGQIPFTGELRLSYERMLTHNQSVTAGFSYNYLNPFFAVAFALGGKIPFPISMQGARVQAGYRFYPIKKLEAPEGFFFGPHVSYSFVKVKDRAIQYTEYFISYFNVNLLAGYQFQIDDHFFVEGYTGIGYRMNRGEFVNYARRTTDVQRIGGPVKVSLGINFAYAF
jgi:hypothetical protein